MKYRRPGRSEYLKVCLALWLFGGFLLSVSILFRGLGRFPPTLQTGDWGVAFGLFLLNLVTPVIIASVLGLALPWLAEHKRIPNTRLFLYRININLILSVGVMLEGLHWYSGLMRSHGLGPFSGWLGMGAFLAIFCCSLFGFVALTMAPLRLRDGLAWRRTISFGLLCALFGVVFRVVVQHRLQREVRLAPMTETVRPLGSGQ